MKEELHIDILIKKQLHADDLDKPAPGFAQKVMSSLPEMDFKTEPYQPLLPRRVKVAIFCIVALITGYALFFPQGPSVNIFNISFLSRLTQRLPAPHLRFDIPASVVFLVSMVSFLLFIQTVVISRYLRRTL